MYEGNRILAIIPARGGSKGIKNKNIMDFHGKPLIAHTIEYSLKSQFIDKTIVSTDSEKIAEISKEYGADIPFLRPAKLASDTAKTIDVVLHAVNELQDNSNCFDVVVLLQPTQPLRTNDDIDKAIELFSEKGMQGLVSVSPVDDNPILVRTIDDNNKLTSLLDVNSTCRRQDMPEYYRVNGCIYINLIKELSENTSLNDNPIGFVMKKKNSVDIDSLKDVEIANYYINTDNI